MAHPRRRRRLQRTRLPVVLVALALIAGACTGGGSAGATPGPSVIRIGSPLLGKPTPPLAGATIDGTPFDLASLRGSPVIVNFWASWCAPCRDEFPLLADAEKRHAAAGLKIVGVLFKDEPGPATEFVVATGTTWPNVTDPARTLGSAWGVLAPPQTYFIDRDGVIRDVQIGQVRSAEELDGILAQILR